MKKQSSPVIKDVVKSMGDQGRIEDAIDYIANIFGSKKVHDYLDAWQFVEVNDLMMSLQDELKAEANALDEVNHDVEDIEPLTVKLNDIQLEEAPYYDTSYGELDADPIDTTDLMEMIDRLSK